VGWELPGAVEVVERVRGFEESNDDLPVEVQSSYLRQVQPVLVK
jgi:hypothetical protein